jgi:lipoprotein-releasing system ATP-binding protein
VEQAAIRTEGLTKTYRSGANDLTVFANLNFSVAQGERVALTGASGAGKSSLLHCIGGLDRPSKGKIFCGDRDLQTLTEKELAEYRNLEVGFVWQIHYLLPEFSAEENVMMPLLIRGVPHAAASREALARLDEVGLRARAHHRAGELSGGEQQRVVLARALVGRPKYLLADEPTGNLDERTGEMIGGLLRDLHRTHGLTSVYVTHNPTFARSCDRVLCLQNGELAHV